MRTISLAAVACILLVGCSSPTTVTRLGAKTATLLALNETDASQFDADAIGAIAITVRGVVGDGPLDTSALRLLVLDAIASSFDGQQRLIYLAVVDELLVLIEMEIANADDPLDLGEAGIYISAAALGVEQGASLYILFIEE